MSSCIPVRGDPLPENSEDDPTIAMLNRRMRHMVLVLREDGNLYEDDTIRASDYNVMRRYELYGDEESDAVHAQFVIRHDKGRFLDIYYYDKQRMNEVRFVVNYKRIDSLSFNIDHKECTSHLILRFDAYKEVEFVGCPVEMAMYLSDVFFPK